MIARSEAAMVQPLQIVAEITEATGAILAEAEAADCAARVIAEVTRGITVVGMFLRVRLNRLAAAAEDAIAAVQDEVYDPRPARRPVPRLARPAR